AAVTHSLVPLPGSLVRRAHGPPSGTATETGARLRLLVSFTGAAAIEDGGDHVVDVGAGRFGALGDEVVGQVQEVLDRGGRGLEPGAAAGVTSPMHTVQRPSWAGQTRMPPKVAGPMRPWSSSSRARTR